MEINEKLHVPATILVGKNEKKWRQKTNARSVNEHSTLEHSGRRQTHHLYGHTIHNLIKFS